MKSPMVNIFISSFAITWLLALSCITLHANSANIVEGHWVGSCKSKEFSMSFSVDIVKADSSYIATFSSEEQRVLNIPLQSFKLQNDSIFFELHGDNDTWLFRGILKEKDISGQIIKGHKAVRFYLDKQPLEAKNFKSLEVTFNNDTVVLSGTLFLPQIKEKVPAVIFMHGSGNEQRFASVYMAVFLAQHGIASLVYDKRGTGKSTGNWQNSSFKDLANDAIAGVKLLEKNQYINADKIGIYGHSQGGAICPMALNLYAKIAFGISAASAGVSMMESDWYEVQNRFKNYVTGDDYNNAMIVMKKYLNFASSGTGYTELIQEAKKFENKQWYQDYIGAIDTNAFFFSYYRKTGKYNPIEQWKLVRQPTLILKGDSDQTTPGYPSFQNVENALKLANNKNYKIVIFKNTTHEMHLSGSSNDFWFKATPGYCDTIYNWISQAIINKQLTKANLK